MMRADIGGHADVDLLNAEERVGRCVAHVGCGDHVDRATDTTTLYGDEHRHPCPLHAREGVLQVQGLHAQVRVAAPGLDRLCVAS